MSSMQETFLLPRHSGLEGLLYFNEQLHDVWVSQWVCLGGLSAGVGSQYALLTSSHLDRGQGTNNFISYSAALDNRLRHLRDQTPLHAATWWCPDTRRRQEFSLRQCFGSGCRNSAARSRVHRIGDAGGCKMGRRINCADRDDARAGSRGRGVCAGNGEDCVCDGEFFLGGVEDDVLAYGHGEYDDRWLAAVFWVERYGSVPVVVEQGILIFF